jgi:Holliday junction resolvasome RuvABC DNA-binding subunit
MKDRDVQHARDRARAHKELPLHSDLDATKQSGKSEHLNDVPDPRSRSASQSDPGITQLVELGFSRDEAMSALAASDNNMEQAVGLLLDGN